jgi:hypothetical protein
MNIADEVAKTRSRKRSRTGIDAVIIVDKGNRKGFEVVLASRSSKVEADETERWVIFSILKSSRGSHVPNASLGRSRIGLQKWC